MEKRTLPEDKNLSYVVNWLFACALMVVMIVVVGAVTRLTNSGLSIVEWKPIMGILPPLSEAEWIKAFDLYKQSPEFVQKHFWMEMHDFKGIFFWEWFHRVLARGIGVVYALPLIFFWVRGFIPNALRGRMVFLFILGGCQGLLGWYMVQSGLIDRPSVSHYRLAAHLSLALVIFSAFIWTALDVRRIAGLQTALQKGAYGSVTGVPATPKSVIVHAWIVLLVICVTILWGAFTAGMDAGLIYNDSFPKMGGAWVPPDMWQLSPHWKNFFENHAGIQFTHRWLGIITVVMVIGFFVHGYLRGYRQSFLFALPVMVLLQMALGIATLLSHVAIFPAAIHQLGAVCLLFLMIVNIHALHNLERH